MRERKGRREKGKERKEREKKEKEETSSKLGEFYRSIDYSIIFVLEY
jgi:hypothetical protein